MLHIIFRIDYITEITEPSSRRLSRRIHQWIVPSKGHLNWTRISPSWINGSPISNGPSSVSFSFFIFLPELFHFFFKRTRTLEKVFFKFPAEIFPVWIVQQIGNLFDGHFTIVEQIFCPIQFQTLNILRYFNRSICKSTFQCTYVYS